jgi:hypothetical protein
MRYEMTTNYSMGDAQPIRQFDGTGLKGTCPQRALVQFCTRLNGNQVIKPLYQ